MSVDAAKEFLEKMRTDEAYAQSVVEAESQEARAKLVKEQGFEFNKEDLESAAAALSAGEAELGDAELDGVAGGAGRSGGNSAFRMAMGSLTRSASFSAGSMGAAGWKCDTSGSETECVC